MGWPLPGQDADLHAVPIESSDPSGVAVLSPSLSPTIGDRMNDYALPLQLFRESLKQLQEQGVTLTPKLIAKTLHEVHTVLLDLHKLEEAKPHE